MIQYITKVEQEDGTTFVLSANGKSISVIYKPDKPYTYDKTKIEAATYIYGVVKIYNDLTVYSSKAHLAEIVLAIELVKVIKEHNESTN